jgi:uncharacterized protein (TIGR02246 family)
MTPRETLAGLFAAWDAGDAVRAAAHFAPDATYREAKHDPIVGREAILAHFTRFFRDGPRWRFVPEETTVEGERAAVAYRFEIFSDIGGWSSRRGCALVHFSAGALTAWREYEG